MSWVTCSIGDALQLIQNGINCKQSKDTIGDKISRIETISDAKVNFNKVGYAALSESERIKAQLHKNDILFSHINSPIHVGKTAHFNAEEPLFHGINLLRLRVNKNIDSRFFNYFLNRLFWSGYWKRTAKQSVNQASVNQTDIKGVSFSYPPIPEQKRIVAILDQAFADIDKARANAEQNLKNARELFDSYLQQVFSQRGEGWVETSLGEIADVEYGYTDKSTEEGDFRYIRITDIDKNGELISENKKYIRYTQEAKKFIALDKDLLMARTGATFAKLLLYRDYEPSVFASYLIRINFKEDIDNELYWHFSKTQSYWSQADELKSGAAQPHFNGAALKQVRFPYPQSREEQTALIQAFNALSIETQRLEVIFEQKLVALEELKKSLLQKAFSGEPTKSKGMAA